MKGHLIAITVTAIVVSLSILVHYEVLGALTNLLKQINVHRRRIILLISGLLCAHLIEVWIFAFGYLFIDQFAHAGSLTGMTHMGLLDYVYFSAVTYSTVGYGDIVPIGPVRFLNAMEALTGLVLVAWSASFTFLEMKLYWRDK